MDQLSSVINVSIYLLITDEEDVEDKDFAILGFSGSSGCNDFDMAEEIMVKCCVLCT